MRTTRSLLTAVTMTAVLFAFLFTTKPAIAEDDLAPQLRAALVKVHITSQSWNAASPWKKDRPRNYSMRGVMVRPGLVLTPANGVSNHLMIEVSVANTSRRYKAALEHVDYDANLALVRILDEDLLTRMKPLPMGDPVTIDDEFDIWQLGGSDLLEHRTARVQKVSASWVRLHLNVKTTLSDRGNGQVALKDGKIVGLVTGTRSNRQEGTILALETIRHYLDDHGDGRYDGFGHTGLWWHDLLRDDLRSHFGVPEGVSGIVVSHVVKGRTGDGVLVKGDVITHLNGRTVDDEGMYAHPRHGRLNVIYALFGETQAGKTVPARIIREGKPREVAIPIRDWPRSEQLIPENNVDRRPPYMVVGGLVILELTQASRANSAAQTEYQSRAWWNPVGERKRIIYASRVLADVANKGLDRISDAVIIDVNGRKITCMKDVGEALKTPKDGFHVFTFEGNEKNFVIRADEIEAIDARIAERYRVSAAPDKTK